MPSTWRTLVLARVGPTTGAAALGPASAAHVDIDLVSGTTSGGLADSGGIFTTASAGDPVMTAGPAPSAPTSGWAAPASARAEASVRAAGLA